MILDDNLISKLENLAKLRLSPEERSVIQRDLNAIVDMLDKLHEVDTSGVKPLTHLHTDRNVHEVDGTGKELDRQTALENAPLSTDAYFAVPNLLKTIDKASE